MPTSPDHPIERERPEVHSDPGPLPTAQRNIQEGPWPDELFDLVQSLRYREGWRFYLSGEDRGQDCRGLTFAVLVTTVNSYEPYEEIRVRHLFPVPTAAYNRDAWQRWLFEQVLLVERHECMEFFTVAGKKPFAPIHAPGADPYTVTQVATELERRTNWRGEVSE